MSDLIPFRDLVEFAIGGGWGTDTPEGDDTQVAVIRGTDFADVKLGITENLPRRFERSSKLRDRLLKEGDLLLEISGGSSAKGQSTGRSLLVEARWFTQLTHPAIPASFCRVIRVRRDRIEPTYAYLALQEMHSSGRAFEYENRSTGISNFQFQHFLDAERLRLPSLAEQRAIASVVLELDEKVFLNRSMSQTLEALAQATFKSWFIDFDPLRLLQAGASGDEVAAKFAIRQEDLRHFDHELVEVEGRAIPASWRLSTLGSEVRTTGGLLQTGPFGSQLHASDYSDDGVPVVMPQDMVNRRITTDRIARVPEEVADSLGRHKLRPGDVVYSRRGDVERHARVTGRETGWLCGTGCLLVRMGSAWPSRAYLSEALNDRSTREWIVRHAVGATMPNLNTSILSALPLLVPPLELLREYERVVAPLMAQQEALSAEAESLSRLRDELLPRLLSGELIVP